MSSSAGAGKTNYTATEKACDCLIGIVFMTVLAVVICITPAITRLLILIQPKLPDFNIHSSSLITTNISKADWNVNLIIDNLDRNGFYYDHIQASSSLVQYSPSNNNDLRVVSTSNITIEALEQKGRGQERINAVFRNMTMNCSSGCGMRMELRLRAVVEYRGWTWPVKRDSIRVVCKTKDMEINESSRYSGVEFGRSGCEIVSGRWKKLVREWTSLFWDYLYVLVIFLAILVLSF